MFIKKTIVLLGLPLFAALPVLLAPAAESSAVAAAKPATKLGELFPDTVIVKGKGVEIKRSQLDDAMLSIKTTAAAQGQTIPPDHLSVLEQQVLDRLIQIQLLTNKATEADKKSGKDSTDERMADIKTRAGSDEALEHQLKLVGTTQQELRGKMVEEATAQAVLERELKLQVSQEEVKKYYDDNPAKFEQPEMVRASHILLGTRDPETGKDLPEDKKAAKHKQAEALLKRARAGEDFAKLAKENSEDPGSKDKGGEYEFPRGQMVPEFEAAAFSLKTNEISDIVTTQFGYHIIKLSEKIPAKKVELAKVAPRVKEFLTQQQMQKRQQDVQEYVDKLKKNAGIQILDEALKAKAEAANSLPPGHPSLGNDKKPEAKQE
jgi:peptidyl-prolyl cis-trans isomerase C